MTVILGVAAARHPGARDTVEDMGTLIAEDLLLLLLDDDKGTMAAASAEHAVLGGAVLTELALTGAVSVEDKSGFWATKKVRVEPGADAQDPVLLDALELIASKGRSAQDLVGRLGKDVKEALTERLVQRGILERRDGKILGLFPHTTWPAVDSLHEDDVRRALTATLVQGVSPDQRTAALVALLHAVGQSHKVVDRGGLPASAVRKRAKEISEGEWAAKAVKDAITASTAAVASVAAGAAVAGSS